MYNNTKLIKLVPGIRTLSSSSQTRAVLLDYSFSLVNPPINPNPPPPPKLPSSLTPPPASTERKRIPIPIPPPSSSSNTLEIQALYTFLLRLLGQVKNIFPEGTVPNLPQLLQDSRDKSGKVLEEELSYEPNPKSDRKLHLNEEGLDIFGLKEGEQDGLVTVCFVYGDIKNPRIEINSGFKIGTSEIGNGDLIVSCSHTLSSISRYFPSALDEASSSSSSFVPSACFVLTSSGHVFPVLSLLSSLPNSDILLLRISPEPMRDPSYALKSSSSSSPNSIPTKEDIERKKLEERKRLVPRLKSLPISPYPSPSGNRIASLIYRHPMSQEGSSNTKNGGKGKQRDFAMGRIVEYTDQEGKTSQTGSYDQLSSFSFTSIPTAGDSGGPIIDIGTGSVVGIIRGSRHSYGDKGYRGFGTPAEKIFELFRLPGMGKKDQ